MDAAGAVEIFSRSIKKNGLIYNEYLGDGDSSSYSEVVSSEPYKEHGNIVAQKFRVYWACSKTPQYMIAKHGKKT